MHYSNEVNEYYLFISDILLGFMEESIEVMEETNVTKVCIEVCEGTLKRDVVITVEEESITANCKQIKI